MNSAKPKRRSGLILLVVLGMLSLFSMLAITYVVFARQSRNANLGMARRDFRGTPPSKLLDDALRQVLRGSSDVRSVMWRQGLLGDLYGNGSAGSDGFIVATARTNLRDNPGRASRVNWLLPALPFAANALEAPRLLGGTFLKVPLQWNAALPEQHDVWNGRVVTFLNGPLAGESFRVVRYLGQMDSAPTPPTTPPPSLIYEQALQYSITIDLSSALQKMITVGTTTASLEDWITNASTSNGAILCYNTGTTPATAYSLQINSGPLNSFGSGVAIDGTVETNSSAVRIPMLRHLPAGRDELPPAYQSLSMALFPNFAHTRSGNPGFEPSGDLDEPMDVPDYRDFHLAYRHAGATSSEDIIPSFHRPAVINNVYSTIVGATPLASFTPMDLVSTIELLQRACGRPLSFTITNLPPIPAGIAPTNGILSQHPNFTGSNLGEYPPPGGADLPQTPTLTIDWSQWTNGTDEQDRFEHWVRWLMKGPWDVDTDADGMADANWVDLNLPLITSREGKLLKMLAAFYVEDLGGRLDLNASGNLSQAFDINYGLSGGTGAVSTDDRFAFASSDNLIPQGLGYGTAEISLRHFFGSPAEYLRFIGERNGANRYTPQGNLNSFGTGANGNDLASQLRERHRVNVHNATRLPGLPSSVFGKTGLGIDLAGNPILFDNTQLNQIVDDPYESHVLAGAYRDHLITIPEWERLARIYDWDRSSLPERLERLLSPGSAAAGLDASRSLTPRSSTLATPTFGGTYQYTRMDPDPSAPQPPNPPRFVDRQRRVNSFPELIEALGQQRFIPAWQPTTNYRAGDMVVATIPAGSPNLGNGFQTGRYQRAGNGLSGTMFDALEEATWTFVPVRPYPYFSRDAITQLFPLEFHHNIKFDLNRPFGNGADDNGNGMVDEPDEVAAGQFAEYANVIYNTAQTGAGNEIFEQYALSGGEFDRFYEDTTNRTAYERNTFGGNQGRQLMARHLYCLAQLILPEDYIFPNQPDPATPYLYGSPERARILAQWAINVVDYRDADAAMTRFPYDDDPLTPKSGGVFWEPTDGVVWGREAQEVVLTESLAFHDLRISEKQNPPQGDNQWQQLRIPQGSLFLELMCTRSRFANNGQLSGVPSGLYNLNTNANPDLLQLNLSALSPADNQSPPQRYPVWRVLLLDPHATGDSVDEQYQDAMRRGQLDYQFATDAGMRWSHQTTSPPPTPTINRVVWFANLAANANNLALPGVTGMGPEKVYRNRSGNALLLEGGQYCVVGPRAVTYLGQREQTNNPPYHWPSRHRLALQNGLTGPNEPRSDWVQFWAEDGNPGMWLGNTRPPQSGQPPIVPTPLQTNEPPPTPAAYLRGCATMIASANTPAAWTTITENIGLSISEPTPDAYYPEPTTVLNSDTTGTNSMPDVETGAPGFGSNNYVPDAYVDLNLNPTANSPHDPFDLTMGPLSSGGWMVQGGQHDRPNVETRLNWSTAVLQRLANPDRPWHATLNPYITVDWLPIDLTVFSGEHEILEDNDVYLTSRQKTGMAVDPTSAPPTGATIDQAAGRTHFSYHSESGERTRELATASVADPGYFDYRIPMELIDADDTTAAIPDPSNPRIAAGLNSGRFATLGYLNSRFGLRGINGGTPFNGQYYRSPVYANAAVYSAGGQAVPVAVPFHANRDFVNAYELMSVPLSAPGQMMQDFTPAAPTGGGGFSFNHLLDFEMLAGPNSGSTQKSAAAILELAGTRNPWADTETTLDPQDVFDPTPGTNVDSNLINNLFAIYRAPFNRLPTFVEPGKVNMNTASEDEVLRGLMWSATAAANRNAGTIPYQAALVTSRTNSTNLGSTALTQDGNARLDQALPTQFDGAFVTGFAANRSAVANLQQDNFASTGLLRNQSGSSNRVFDTTELFPGSTVNLPHNPIVQNYGASRLSNLITDRSNVFAVRVVIGFFESSPTTGLGREYGIDEGTYKRHRAFYIIDRSIPVAYQEGADMNSDRCILLRRIIE